MRTTISIPDKDFEEIQEYCKENDMKISAVLRLSAKRMIKKCA